MRTHCTNLLAAFRASMTMFDPLPAVFEGALERLYTEERFCGVGRAMSMEDFGDFDSPAPSLNQFRAALEVQLDQVLQQYQGSEQSIGVIRGGSTVRVEAIIKKLGSILNVPGNGAAFFQRLLQRPAVVELGALGDGSNIALLMAFLLGQFSGHVEYAYRAMARQGKKREHLILIEEAHRLLEGGEGPQAKSAEDLNTMLAEVRKFGQGIMTLDQRPSSLVGGVLDNAFVKILTRLSDKVGFERLSEELNLDEAQKQFARTRLKAGDAVLIDRDAGMPVLVRADNVKDGLEDNQLEGEAFAQQVRANAERWDLVPPDPEERLIEVEPKPDPPAVSGAILSEKTEANPRELVEQQVGEILKTFLAGDRPEFLYQAHAALQQDPPDWVAALAAADQALDDRRRDFEKALAFLWDQLKWLSLGQVAETYQWPQVRDQILERLTQPAPPRASSASSQAWLEQRWESICRNYLEKERPGLRYQVYQNLKDPLKARQIALQFLEEEGSDWQMLSADLQKLVAWHLVGKLAEEYQDSEALRAIQSLRESAEE